MGISTQRICTLLGLLLWGVPLLAQPVAEFSATPVEGCAPLVVSFKDLSTDAVAWRWETGVGPSTLRNPGKFYTSPGTYTVRLIVFDALGRSDTITKTDFITVYANPEAELTADAVDVCVNQVLQFSDISNPGSGVNAQWSWDFGDGNTSFDENPTHFYSVPGIYPVSLMVTNEFGCSDVVIENNYIEAKAPDVSFTVDQQLACGPPFQVQFQSLGTTTGQHFWDFGDGNTSQQADPNHTYTAVGSFDVLHTITDLDGCQDSLIEEAYISVGVNTLGISARDSSLCRRDTAFFQTNASPNSNVFWDFGNGDTSSLRDPAYVYQQAGTYIVQATVTDSSNCSTTISLPIEIFDFPVVDFAVADTNLSCELPFTVQFQDLSTNALSWEWYFGDQTQSNQQNPVHTYTQADSFKVSLFVTGPNGCRAKHIVRDFIITQPLQAGFDASVQGGCVPLEVGFQDTTNNIFPITSWEWDFGDGSTGVGKNPIHTYQNTGRYTVQLIVENSEGCRDTVAYPNYISVGTPPLTAFEPDTNEVCALQEVQFNNLTTGADSYIWFFGDGDTAMSVNPTHGFAGLDSMDVVLIAYDRGCPDTLIREDLINVLAPLPIIGISDKKICKAPQDVLFQNLSIDSDTWSWVLEDGFTTTDPAFVYPIIDDGYFSVSLTVSNLTTGCTVTATDSLLVRPLNAGFSEDITEGCAPFRVRFTDSSDYANQWKWYFSNGDSSDSRNPVIWFDSIQSYDVTLIVTSSLGCKDTLTKTNHIEGLGIEADFSTATPNNGCLPLIVDFTDLSAGTSNAVSWEWDFGDGTTSTAQNPSHTYSTSGYFTVSLTVTDEDGCTDTRTIQDYVLATKPEANFAVNPSVNCPGSQSRFVTLSSGFGLSYKWSFGDGNGSYLANTLHAYDSVGMYDVKLVVTDVNGCKDSLDQTDHVKIEELKATFIVDSTFASCPPLTSNFLSDTTFDHPNISWHWDFGDGATGSHPFPSHIYSEAGIYDITFVIQSASGCYDSVLVEDMIEVRGPAGSFSFGPEDGCPGTEIMFEADSANTIAYTWLYGDGDLDSGQYVSHVYQDPGLYQPVLVLQDSAGCQVFNQLQDTIHIFEPITADFTATTSILCDSGDITFIDLSQTDGNISRWLWTFGDGDSSEQQYPDHRYTQVGTYDVKLIVWTDNGCSDSLFIPAYIEVVNSPEPQIIDLDPLIGCHPLPVSGNGNVSANSHPITIWRWNMGDSTVHFGQSFNHVYQTAGEYSISFSVMDTFGCVSAVYDTVQVLSPPDVRFTASDSLNCSPIDIQFTDLNPGGIVSWQWDFGDGNTSTDQNPLHSYQQDGLYTVSLTLTDTIGCTSVGTKQDYIHLRHPEANFLVQFPIACPGNPVDFTNSSHTDTTFLSFVWEFGDGNQSSDVNPSHIYQQPGQYDVKLTVTDIFGCVDSIETTAVQVLEDRIPKVLAMESVSVLDGRTVKGIFQIYPNVDADFGMYIVYRKNASGTFEEISRIFDINQNQFVDNMASPQTQSECYKVQVVNFCGSTYDLALADEHCTIQLETTAGIEMVQIDWSAYVGWSDVEQYTLYRVEDYDPNNLTWLGQFDGDETSYIDTDLFCYDSYSYRIEALGPNREQSLSDTAFAEPVHLAPSDPSHVRTVTVENNDFISVSWEDPVIENPVELIVERDAGQGFFEVYREGIQSGISKFQDQRTAVEQQMYTYRAFTVDTCGDVTPLGRTGRSILLQADRVAGSINLSWTPYQGWENGVAQYVIERFDETAGTFADIATVDSTTFAYTDDGTAYSQASNCYRIIAFEQEGNSEQSVSNEACAVLDGKIIAPNAFSPNGDGKNDFFSLRSVFLSSFHLEIYNRWGEKIFESTDPSNEWDGMTQSGEAAAEGVYVFVARGIDHENVKVQRVGSVTLIR